MRQQDGWIFTEDGKTAVEQAIAEKKRTMRWLWEKIKRPQTNWYHATGKRGRSTSLQTLREVLDALGLEHKAKTIFSASRPVRRSRKPTPSRRENSRGAFRPPIPFFTGRTDILERLHGALAIGDAALIPFPQALNGHGRNRENADRHCLRASASAGLSRRVLGQRRDRRIAQRGACRTRARNSIRPFPFSRSRTPPCRRSKTGSRLEKRLAADS